MDACLLSASLPSGLDVWQPAPTVMRLNAIFSISDLPKLNGTVETQYIHGSRETVRKTVFGRIISPEGECKDSIDARSWASEQSHARRCKYLSLTSRAWATCRCECATNQSAASHKQRREYSTCVSKSHGCRDAMAVGTSSLVVSCVHGTTCASPAQASSPDTCTAKSAAFLCHDCVTTCSHGVEILAQL